LLFGVGYCRSLPGVVDRQRRGGVGHPMAKKAVCVGLLCWDSSRLRHLLLEHFAKQNSKSVANAAAWEGCVDPFFLEEGR
jgi:hypothetical protein